MPEFTLRRFADISTAHVRKTDLPLLLRKDAPGHLANEDELLGSFFYITEEPEVLEYDIAEYRAFGFSEEYCNIVRELSRQRIVYCRFDCDGYYVEGLPTPGEDE